MALEHGYAARLRVIQIEERICALLAARLREKLLRGQAENEIKGIRTMAESMKGHEAYLPVRGSNRRQMIGSDGNADGLGPEEPQQGRNRFRGSSGPQRHHADYLRERTDRRGGARKRRRCAASLSLRSGERSEARRRGQYEKLATGTMEVQAENLRILAEAETPPFPVEENSKTKDEVRLKYRYLDLRRPDMQSNLMLRSKIAYLTASFSIRKDFWRLRRRCSERARRRARGTIWCRAVCIRAAFTRFRSPHSCLSSF
jgi:hypothetical protein